MGAIANMDPDDKLREAKFNYLDIVWLLFSIVSFLVDMAVLYYNDEHGWYFGLTLAFTVLPALTMSTFSAMWYNRDQNRQVLPPVSRNTWLFRILFFSLFTEPSGEIRRHSQLRRPEQKSEKAKGHAQMAHFYDADATFLRLFECFM